MRFEQFAARSAKWDFSPKSLKDHGVVDKDMLMECWAYEFSRENEELVKAICAWRNGLGTSLSFEQLLRAYAGSPLLQVDGRFFTIPFPAIYVFSPEWPKNSFLEIASEKRNERVTLATKKRPGKVRGGYSWYTWQRNWEKDLDEYPNLEADPKSLGLHKESGWDQLVRDLMPSVSSSNKLRAFLDEEPANILSDAQYLDPKADPFIYAQAECVLFRIPWKYSNKVLGSLMARWLKENRPASENPPKISGKAKTGKTRLQNMKKRLEMLGKWRLVKKNHEDISTPHPLENKPLFRDCWRWNQTEEMIIRERRLFEPLISDAPARSLEEMPPQPERAPEQIQAMLEESRRNVLPPRSRKPRHKRP
jgi:hypothetical protein